MVCSVYFHSKAALSTYNIEMAFMDGEKEMATNKTETMKNGDFKYMPLTSYTAMTIFALYLN